MLSHVSGLFAFALGKIHLLSIFQVGVFPQLLLFLIVIIPVPCSSCQQPCFFHGGACVCQDVSVKLMYEMLGMKPAGRTSSCMHGLNSYLSLKSVKKLSISRTRTIKALDLHQQVNSGSFTFACFVLRYMKAMLVLCCISFSFWCSH